MQNGLLGKLEQISSEGFIVFIEPLQEWLFVRNSLAVCAQLYVSAKDPDKRENPLSSNLFSHHDHHVTMKQECFLAAFGLNTFWRFESAVDGIDSGSKYPKSHMLVNPLERSVTEYPDRFERFFAAFRFYAWKNLKGHEDVCFPTAGVVNKSGANLKRVDDAEDLRIWLAILIGEGETEQDAVRKTLKVFEEALFCGPGGSWADIAYGQGIEGRKESDGIAF